MSWRLLVGLEDGAWSGNAEVPVDARLGWVEPGDGAIAGYQARRYEDESEANNAARLFRARGITASTELVDEPDEVDGMGQGHPVRRA